MAAAFSLRVFMPQGEPRGLRIIEKTNWTGVGLIFPRTRLDEARARDELKRTGVYVLWNDDEEVKPLVYVGQSEDVAKRMKQHDRDQQMDWWTMAAAFTTKDDGFNQAHARWLESTLIQRARAGNRCDLRNRNEPAKPSISEPDEADADHFLEDLLQCLPLSGLTVFDARATEPEPLGNGDVLELYFNRPNLGLSATARPGANGFTVLQGAQVRRDEDLPPGYQSQEQQGYKALRRRLINDSIITDPGGGEPYVLQQDWTFSSPSQANVVLMGRPGRPYRNWLDKQGRTWADIRQAAAEAETDA